MPYKIIILIFFFFIILITPKSNNQIIIDFQYVLMTIGLLVIAIIPLFMLTLLFNSSIKSIIDLASSALLKIAFLFITTNYIVSQFGDAALLYFSKHPESQFLLLILIILTISSLNTILSNIYNSNSVTSNSLNLIPENSGKTAMKVNRVMTKDDLSLVAAHETGHLLLSYLYGEFPDDFRAEIFFSNPEHAQGFVSHIHNDNISSYKTYDLWRMYVLLSGQIGESFLVNINTNGSNSDFEKWQKLAIRYLENQYEGFYYLNPETDLEFNHNLLMLNNLKSKQTESILMFMKTNKILMNELYNELVSKKVLYSKDLNVYFEKVHYLENMPYPNGRQFIKTLNLKDEGSIANE